jgi:hypothetical protein
MSEETKDTGDVRVKCANGHDFRDRAARQNFEGGGTIRFDLADGSQVWLYPKAAPNDNDS